MSKGDDSEVKKAVLKAAKDGEMEKLELLLEAHPGYIECRYNGGWTPLHLAAHKNHIEICRYLLSKGANPESKTDQGWTTLHCACCWWDNAIVALLLRHGIDVNARSMNGMTPLHVALDEAEDDVDRAKTTIKYLLEAPGVEMEAVMEDGEMPLTMARQEHPELFELLTYYLNRP